MRVVTWVATVGWLLICPHGRSSLRQTKEEIPGGDYTERMSAHPLGSMAASGLKASRGGKCCSS